LSIETAFARVPVGGGSFHVCTEAQVVSVVRAALDRGAGGRIITPNVDVLRQAGRDAEVRDHLADASLVVADGMPLVWASRLAGTPLPERVCGAGLIWSLAAGLGRDGRSVYVLGGEPADPPAALPGVPRGGLPGMPRGLPIAPRGLPGVPRGGLPGRQRAPLSPASYADAAAAGYADAAEALRGGPVRDGAWRAGQRLVEASPGLRIAGWHSPAYGFDRDAGAVAAVRRLVAEARPDLVYVGLGFPKQERVISQLRADLPFTWFLGCGAAINFVAGDRRRAPRWMQLAGLEWAHRLVGEPRRLAGRYVRHDAPYAARLLARAWTARYRHHRRR
jgi:N-acetylglucosaminyldiphosphoundecaprenol N-acetyl-beta-D-mannosaminyltransferase